LCAKPAARHCFRCGAGTSSFPPSSPASCLTVPQTLRPGFILSCALSPSKFLRRSSRLGSPASPARVSPPIAASRKVCLLPGVSTRSASARPPPLRSVLGFSQPLDGFLHLLVLRACFIPLPRPGFISVQGFLPDHSSPEFDLRRAPSKERAPSALSARLVAAALPPCRCAGALTGEPAATRSLLGSEALLRDPTRSRGRVVEARSRSLPSSASLLLQVLVAASRLLPQALRS